MLTLLALAVPLLYFAALMSRDPIPEAGRPESAAPIDPSSVVKRLDPGDSSFRLASPILIVRDAAAPSGLSAVFDVPADENLPDVLVYWQAAEGPGPEPLLDALLIGSLAAGRRDVLQLPVAAHGETGRLVIYSVAHREVLTIASLEP